MILNSSVVRRRALVCLLTCAFFTAFIPIGGTAEGPDEKGPDEKGKPATASEDSEKGTAAGCGLLDDDEIANIAGGMEPDTIFGDGDDFGRRIRDAMRSEPIARNGVRATHRDVPYGEHPRNRFDLWSASVGPDDRRPLVVFIHGGGFRRGDKSLLYSSSTLVSLLDAGISVTAINYRFSHQHADGTLGSLRDIARGLQTLRHHADRYRIDPERVACYGGSAGGAASLWLAFSDDLADPSDPDPIGRQSTRLTCAGAMATPSTLDILKWEAILGISREQTIAAARTFGIRDLAELERPKFVNVRRETDLVGLISADDPPVFIHNNEKGGVPTGVGHMAHHPAHAKILKDRADAMGIDAVVYAPEIGLRDGRDESLVDFLTRYLVD